MSTPSQEPGPNAGDGTPGAPGQAPLPGQLGYPGQPGVGPAPEPVPYGYGYGYGYGSPPSEPAGTSSVAIVAVCLFWVPLVGLVLSIIGMVKTARGKARGRGIAITALVLSILVTAGAVLVGVAIGSKPSALDPGCTNGKRAIVDQSKKIETDHGKGDDSAVQADVQRMLDELKKAVADSKRDDVRSAMQAVLDDYTAIEGGKFDEPKLEADLNQVDHLCTIGS
ncbi:DUF4190 domain-containing protein [Catenulispora subtropica]|uniref:DUF4190 domain-containing protein n=1 Tax=Catenulispora subtropica TaxID=450798 RepID=A0ABP5CB94_9ACTN